MMTMPALPLLAQPYSDKARRHKDGSVLLSIADDRICKLNGVGALTWMVLEEAVAGLTVDEVVRQLQAQFDAINSEGELSYEVSTDQLTHDTSHFLNKLASMNLLQTSRDQSGRESYRISKDVSGTTSTSVVEVSPNATDESVEPAKDLPASKRETFCAFIGLLGFDLLLKCAGFHALLKRVEHWPTKKPQATDRNLCRRVRTAVDRAQMYYPKKAMCLQHSAVVTCLLRRRGVPAQMVLGAQEFPPKAHAWVEVSSEVVNDSTDVKNNYRPFRRL